MTDPRCEQIALAELTNYAAGELLHGEGSVPQGCLRQLQAKTAVSAVLPSCFVGLVGAQGRN
jgi:hypothetical protein